MTFMSLDMLNEILEEKCQTILIHAFFNNILHKHIDMITNYHKAKRPMNY